MRPVWCVCLILGLSAFLLVVMVAFSGFVLYSEPCLRCMRDGTASGCEELLEWLHKATVEGREDDPLYVLMYGTLLGAVREGSVISHDGDVDLSVLPGRMPELVSLIRQHVPRVKVFVSRSGDFARVCYQPEDPSQPLVPADLFSIAPTSGNSTRWEETNKMMRLMNSHSWVQTEELFPVKLQALSGRQFWVPNNSEAILERLYGDWRTPRQSKKPTPVT